MLVWFSLLYGCLLMPAIHKLNAVAGPVKSTAKASPPAAEKSYMQLVRTGRAYGLNSLWFDTEDGIAECFGCRIWPLALVKDDSCSNLCSAELDVNNDAVDDGVNYKKSEIRTQFDAKEIPLEVVIEKSSKKSRDARSTKSTTSSSSALSRRTTTESEARARQQANMLASIESERPLWSLLKPYKEGTVPDKLKFLPVKRNQTRRSKRDAWTVSRENAEHYLDAYFGSTNTSTPLNVDTLPLFYPPPVVTPPQRQMQPIDLLEDALRTQRGLNPTPSPTEDLKGGPAASCLATCHFGLRNFTRTIKNRLRSLPEKTVVYYNDTDRASREVLIHTKKDELPRLVWSIDKFLTAAAKFARTTTTNSTVDLGRLVTFVEYRRDFYDYNFNKDQPVPDRNWTRANAPVNISWIWDENIDDHKVGIHLHGLSPHTTYKMRIALYLAYNNTGEPYYLYLGSKDCYHPVITADEGVPLFKPVVEKVTATDDSIVVLWKFPRSPTAPIKGYVLELRETPAGNSSTLLPDGKKPQYFKQEIRNTRWSTNARFSYLKNSTAYSFRIVAANRAGSGPAYTQTIMTKERVGTQAKNDMAYIMSSTFLRKRTFPRDSFYVDVYNVNYAAEHNLTGPSTLTASTIVKQRSLIYLSDGKTVWARSLDNVNENCTTVVTLREIVNTNNRRISTSDDEIDDAKLSTMFINNTEIDWLNKWLYVAVGQTVYRYHLLHEVSQELVRLPNVAGNKLNQLRVDPINGYFYITTFRPALYQTTLDKFDALTENNTLPFSQLRYMGATSAIDIDPRTGYLVYGLFSDETIRETLCTAESLDDQNSRLLRISGLKGTYSHFGNAKNCREQESDFGFCSTAATSVNALQQGLAHWGDDLLWLVHGQFTQDGQPNENGIFRSWPKFDDRPDYLLFNLILITPKYQPSPQPLLAPQNIEALFSVDDVYLTWSAPQLLSYQSPAAFRRWSYQIKLSCLTCTAGNARTILDETHNSDEVSWTLSGFVERQRKARSRRSWETEDLTDVYELPSLLPGMSYTVDVRAFYEDNYGPAASAYGRVLQNAAALPNLVLLQQRRGVPALVRIAPDTTVSDDYLRSRAFPTNSTRIDLLPALAQFDIAQILPFQRHLLFTTAAGHLFLQDLPSNQSASVPLPKMISREIEFNDIWLDTDSGVLYWRDIRSLISRARIAYIVQNLTSPTHIETLVLGKAADFLVNDGLMFYIDNDKRRLIFQQLEKRFDPLNKPAKIELTDAKKSASTTLGFAVDEMWPRTLSNSTAVGQNLTEKSLIWVEGNSTAITFYRMPLSILATTASQNVSSGIELILTISSDELANTIGIRWNHMQLLGGRLYGYANTNSRSVEESEKLNFVDLFETMQRRIANSTKVNLLSGAALYQDEDISQFVVSSSQKNLPDISRLVSDEVLASVMLEQQETQQAGAFSSWLAIPVTLAVLLPVVAVLLCGTQLYNKRRKKSWQKRQVEQITAEVVTRTEEQQQRNIVVAAAAVAAQQQQPRYADPTEACSPFGLICPLPTMPLATLRDPHCNVHIQKLLYIGSANLLRDRALGQGHFGSVYRGSVKLNPDRDRAPAVACAVKIIPRHENPQQDDVVLREARSMADLQHHPHIIRLYGVCVEADTISLVMELMDGDVLRWMEKRRAQKKRACDLTGKLLCFLRDVADAFACMEEAQFVHRDLAARNCLIKRMNGRPWPMIKVGDFGLARDMYDDGCYVINRERSMPVSVMSPESFAAGVFTTATDVWSFGILIHELFSLGSLKPYNVELRELKKEIVNNGLMPNMLSMEAHGVPPEVCALQAACCQREPHQRPTFALILQVVERILRQYTTVSGTPPASASAFSDTNTSASSPRAFFQTSAQIMANVWGDDEDENLPQQMPTTAALQLEQPVAGPSGAHQQVPSVISSGFATIGRRTAVNRNHPVPNKNYRNSVISVPHYQQQLSADQLSAVPVASVQSTQTQLPLQETPVMVRVSHNPSYFSTTNTQPPQPPLPPPSNHEWDQVDSPATVTTSFSTNTLPTRGQIQNRRRQQFPSTTTTFVRQAPRPWSPAALAPLLSRQQRRRSTNAEQSHQVVFAPQAPESDGRSPTSMDSGPLGLNMTLLPPPPSGAQRLLLQHQPVTPATTPTTRNLSSPGCASTNSSNNTFMKSIRRFIPNFFTRPSSSSFILASPPSTTPSGGGGGATTGITTVAAAEHRVSSSGNLNGSGVSGHSGTVRRVQRETSASGPPNVAVNTNNSGESSRTLMNSCFAPLPPLMPHHAAITPSSDNGQINSPSSSRASSREQLRRNSSINGNQENGVAANGAVMYFNPTPYRNHIPDVVQQGPPPALSTFNAAATRKDARGYYYYYTGNDSNVGDAEQSYKADAVSMIPGVSAASSSNSSFARVFHVNANDGSLQPLADIARDKARSGGYEEPVIDI